MINITAMFPVLVASDLDALQGFYQQHFGFRTDFVDLEFYLPLRHPDSGAQLAFMVPAHPSQPEFLHAVAGHEGMVISLEVANAGIAHAYAAKTRLDVVLDLKIEPFGVTHFMVRDPAGFVVDVVEHHEQG